MGAHYPFDVIVGAAWGTILAVGMINWGRSIIQDSSARADRIQD